MMGDDARDGQPPDLVDDVFTRHAAALRRRAQRAERTGIEHLERGMMVSASSFLREAVDTYRSIRDEAHLSSAQQYLALALYELGEVEESVALWEELVERGWARPTTLNFLVRHYERTGEQDEIDRLYARLAEAKERQAEFFEDFRAPAPEAAEGGEDTAGGKLEILVADNDPAVRKVLGRILEFQGYRVLFAEDGEEALGVILDRAPDLVFLDVYMPKHSGLDVLYRMRAEGMHTPVIVITGGPYATMTRDAERLGARFATKPFDFEALGETVRDLLGENEPS